MARSCGSRSSARRGWRGGWARRTTMSPSRRRRPQSLARVRIPVRGGDDDIRKILAYPLGVEGATVTAVSTACEALSFLSSVDIILTDFALPGNDGVWLFEQVKNQPPPP